MEDDVQYEVRSGVLDELIEVGRRRRAVHLAAIHGRWPANSGRRRAELIDVGEVIFTARLETAFRPLRRILDEAREEGDGAPPVVGFGVVHAGSGGRMEKQVAKLHMSLANGPGRVACVVDPETTDVGLYARDSEGDFRNVAFRIANPDREDAPDDSPRASDVD